MVVVPEAAAAPGGIEWGACPKDVAAPGLECSTLRVPLNYQDPGGRTIEVAISRLASTNPGKRRGVVLTNEGGPGGPGLNFPAFLRDRGMPKDVLDAYDVIGFDPRGVGHSTPVTCDLTPEQKARGNVPPYARDAADVAKRAQEVKAVAEQCATSKTAPLLPYITTANTARDMDRIRAALGERKASYLGYSYGTHLGAVYTTLFPRTSDRVVLDSSLPPGGLDRHGGRLMAEGFQKRFPDFAKFVAAHPEYGLGAKPQQVEAKYFELAARLDKAPRPDGMDGALFRLTTFGLLYGDSQFPMLAELYKALNTGGPLPPPPPGAPETDPDNALSSHLYVICGDSTWPKSVGGYQADVATDRVRYPMFGAAAANIRPCAFWPSAPVEPPVRIGGDGPSNVLIAQNLRDPATPLSGAEEMRRALGDRARMVTADQGGHGTYLLGKNKCATEAVNAFLTTGKRPADDIACAAEPA
nr:alpha/beta hydrolase [Amycolatopsis sp. CA-230715]